MHDKEGRQRGTTKGEVRGAMEVLARISHRPVRNAPLRGQTGRGRQPFGLHTLPRATSAARTASRTVPPPGANTGVVAG